MLDASRLQQVPSCDQIGQSRDAELQDNLVDQVSHEEIPAHAAHDDQDNLSTSDAWAIEEPVDDHFTGTHVIDKMVRELCAQEAIEAFIEMFNRLPGLNS
jgi:hypothetical protein